jgi:hypothetical protein
MILIGASIVPALADTIVGKDLYDLEALPT